MIPVTKPFLPPEEEYLKLIDDIYSSCTLTNQGPKVQLFEEEVKSLLHLKNFQYVTNGTVALQLALRALGVSSGEVITTPFSYVATVSAVLWERCKPVFADVESERLTIDPKKIEEKISPNTKAILGVHVFGHPCKVDEIDEISQKYGIPVIYDAAHAFGVKKAGRSIFDWGDVSTCSFHATKLLHTIEGGGCICKSDSLASQIDLIKRFGHNADNHLCLGINAKQSEFHASMGICNLEHFPEILEKRKRLSKKYDQLLSRKLKIFSAEEDVEYNYAYYPVIFPDEKVLLRVLRALRDQEIFARRYFYPSLNTLPYLGETNSCPVSEDISLRILCLPLYYDLEGEDVERICSAINREL